jgi:hypothetical protein
MRYRVVAKGGRHTYPADPVSLARVLRAGGWTKLTPGEQATVVLKTVGPGEECSDLPPQTRSLFLTRGWIEPIPEHE